MDRVGTEGSLGVTKGTTFTDRDSGKSPSERSSANLAGAVADLTQEAEGPGSIARSPALADQALHEREYRLDLVRKYALTLKTGSR